MSLQDFMSLQGDLEDGSLPFFIADLGVTFLRCQVLQIRLLKWSTPDLLAPMEDLASKKGPPWRKGPVFFDARWTKAFAIFEPGGPFPSMLCPPDGERRLQNANAFPHLEDIASKEMVLQA